MEVDHNCQPVLYNKWEQAVSEFEKRIWELQKSLHGFCAALKED
jgi:hypothetical protein